MDISNGETQVNSNAASTESESDAELNAAGVPISPSGASPTRPTPGDVATDVSHSGRNFVVMASYLVIQRLGWIFKTESIIMPAVADLIGVGSWLRGWLPILSRFGLSVPPLMVSEKIQQVRQKRIPLFFTSQLMSACFLFLAWAWMQRSVWSAPTVAIAFLAVYTVFFIAVGVNQLLLGTLTGKLIPATQRGRLLLAANCVGAAVAIGAALWLLPQWLNDPADFVSIFLFVGIAFGLNGGVAMLLYESPEPAAPRKRTKALRSFGDAVSILRQDAMFCRVAVIGALFGLSFALFPHYQAIARDQMGLGHTNMVWWVVVQNMGTAVFSVLVGPFADRRGNRAVLRVALLLVIAAPLLAITLPHWESGPRWFPWVFLLVGMTPVTIRILHNYVLELADPSHHAIYLSTLGLVVGAPVMLSPVVGLLVDIYGFEGVFIGISGLVVVAWLLTWRISEPRFESRTQPWSRQDEVEV